MSPGFGIGIGMNKISSYLTHGGGGMGPPPERIYRSVFTWNAGDNYGTTADWQNIPGEIFAAGNISTNNNSSAAGNVIFQGFGGISFSNTGGRWNARQQFSTSSSNTGPSNFNTRPYFFYETSSSGHNNSRFRSFVRIFPKPDASIEHLPQVLRDEASKVRAWINNHTTHRRISFWYNASGGGFYNDDHGLIFYSGTSISNLRTAVNSDREVINLDYVRDRPAYGFVYPGLSFTGNPAGGTFVNMYRPNDANITTNYRDGQSYPHNETEEEVALAGPWIKHTFRIPFTHTFIGFGLDGEGANAGGAQGFNTDLCITRIELEEEST